MTICTLTRNSCGLKQFFHRLAFVICTICTLLVSQSSHAQQSSKKSGNTSKSPASNNKTAPPCPAMIPISRQNDAAYLAIQGVKCFGAGDYSRAYALYNRAHQIDPNPTLYGAIGRVLHELGVYGLAAVYYNEYLEHRDISDVQGAEMIKSRLTQLDTLLEQQSGTIEVTSAPSQATVFMVLPNNDWLELGHTPLQLHTQTGKYQLIVVHDGFYRQKHNVNLSHNGKFVAVVADLVTENSTFDITARQWRRAGSWTMIAGAPVFLTGVTLLFVGNDDISTANKYSLDSTGHTLAEKRALADRGKSLRNWGIVTSSVGATAILTGAILYVKGSKKDPVSTATTSQDSYKQKSTFSWTPVVGLDQVGLHFSW